MQPLITAPDPFSYPTESLIDKLNPKYLSHIRMVNPDIFDFEMIRLMGMEGYTIIWKYLAHGAIYACKDKLILRSFVDIRTYEPSLTQLKCTYYRHEGKEIITHEEWLNYQQFYQFLDYFIEEFAKYTEPLHLDFLTTRYYETLPIDITVTRAAFEIFKAQKTDHELFLYLSAGSEVAIIVLPSFFTRLQTLFTDMTVLKVHDIVAPVLSNRKALHFAQSRLKNYQSVPERVVKSTVGMKEIKEFKYDQLYAKLSAGQVTYINDKKRFIKDSSRIIRILIEDRENRPYIETAIHGIASHL